LKTQARELSPAALVSLGRIVDGARRLRALISDVQTFVTLRPLPAPKKPCDANQAFDAALVAYDPVVAAIGGTVERGELGTVVMDPIRLINVFSMLIDNAIKYRRTDRPLYVRVDAAGAEAGTVISCTDNGIGIAPEYRERVFQVFERLHNDPDISGTGIGLALVKKIVTLSQGSVWIEAGDTGGCRICLALPVP
jgi:light-regulated signal transduction histidine kinase (bacteriophytochrome)